MNIQLEVDEDGLISTAYDLTLPRIAAERFEGGTFVPFQSDWEGATLAGGYTGTIEYKVTSGIAHVVLETIVGAAGTISTLPVGYRPSRTIYGIDCSISNAGVITVADPTPNQTITFPIA